MKQNKLITMTTKEARQYNIIKELFDKKINGNDASKQLELSLRQIKRIRAKIIKLGIKGIVHANRGRVSHNKTDPKIVAKT